MPRRVSNPPNPWSTTEVEWIGEPPPVEIQVFEEEAKSIVASNDSPDVPFRWSVNPYRGCQHACAYCYARNTHQYLGFGAGTDFDSKIVVKRNAPQLLRERLARRGWKGEWIAFSGVTDCYQPLEASYRLTRACLEVCLEFRNPVGVITKSALARRDLDLFEALGRRGGSSVFLSIPFADEATARAIEPWASSPERRFETLGHLSDAGVETGVAIAPVIPGLNESDVPEILTRAREAGATRAFFTLLHLPAEVRPVFEERIRQAFPGRADKVLHGLEEMRRDQAAPRGLRPAHGGAGAALGDGRRPVRAALPPARPELRRRRGPGDPAPGRRLEAGRAVRRPRRSGQRTPRPTVGPRSGTEPPPRSPGPGRFRTIPPRFPRRLDGKAQDPPWRASTGRNRPAVAGPAPRWSCWSRSSRGPAVDPGRGPTAPRAPAASRRRPRSC